MEMYTCLGHIRCQFQCVVAQFTVLIMLCLQYVCHAYSILYHNTYSWMLMPAFWQKLLTSWGAMLASCVVAAAAAADQCLSLSLSVCIHYAESADS